MHGLVANLTCQALILVVIDHSFDSCSCLDVDVVDCKDAVAQDALKQVAGSCQAMQVRGLCGGELLVVVILHTSQLSMATQCDVGKYGKFVQYDCSSLL